MSLKNAPEIKALLAIDKQLSPLPAEVRQRLLGYFQSLYRSDTAAGARPQDECQE
jgi:hypothetical protein